MASVGPTDSRLKSQRWLHRYLYLLAIGTLILVFAGGNVKSKDAGLAVPDWPTSYGVWWPDGWYKIDNVRAEHGHRMIGAAIGFMMIVMAVWVARVDPRRWVRNLGFILLGAVCVQGLIGGLTVKMMLPAPVSISHGMLGQSIFCLSAAMVLFTSRGWQGTPNRLPSGPGISFRTMTLVLVGAFFFQLFLGGLLRHTESALAIPDFPLAYGKLLPPVGPDAVHNANVDLLSLSIEKGVPIEPVTGAQILIHFAHRLGALMVTALTLWIGLRIFRRYRDRPEFMAAGVALWLLVTLQVLLGAMTVLTMRTPWVATFHVAVGATILAVSVILSLQASRYIEPGVPALGATEALPGKASSGSPQGIAS